MPGNQLTVTMRSFQVYNDNLFLATALRYLLPSNLVHRGTLFVHPYHEERIFLDLDNWKVWQPHHRTNSDEGRWCSHTNHEQGNSNCLHHSSYSIFALFLLDLPIPLGDFIKQIDIFLGDVLDVS